MVLGFLFAVLACFVWGLIFIIPEFLADFSAMEVVLGRYMSYGLLSSVLLFRKGFANVRLFPLHAWVKALIFGLTCNILYYVGIVAGLRFASPPITVLIIGMAPILIAMYGNWHVREVSFKSLAIPCIWIAFGMILINAHEIDWSFENTSVKEYLIGMLGVFAALISWSWYAVQNARFLKHNPQIPSSQWSTLIGVTTLIWTVLLGTFFIFVFPEVNIERFMHVSDETIRFFSAIAVLGIVCSWLGCFLWNRASTYLPVSLMGPFLIFESIFGLFFVFLFEYRLPSWIEVLGFISMIGGIGLSVYTFKKKQLSR